MQQVFDLLACHWPMTRVCQLVAPCGRNEGDASPLNQVSTASARNSYSERLCWVHVAITVQMRSLHCRPASLRVPWVMSRSMTTKRIACSAKLFVGSTPGVVTNVK